MSELNQNKIIISTYKDKNQYLAVGISKNNRKLVRSCLPHKSESDCLQEIKDSKKVRNSNFSFKLSDEYQNLAKNLNKLYNGIPVDFDFELLTAGDFQRNVLLEVFKIPYGEVRTYKDIAEALNTRAYRAVGSSIGKNPLPLIIPCHRVVRSDMTIGGFFGGNRMKKEILLNEGVRIEGTKILAGNIER